MLENQNQPQSLNHVVVGGTPTPPGRFGWLSRLWSRLLPAGSSLARKLVVGGVPIGLVIMAVVLVLLGSGDPPAKTTVGSKNGTSEQGSSESNEGRQQESEKPSEGDKKDTDKKDSEEKRTDPQNNTGGSSGGSSSGSSGGSSGGGSSGGNSGGGGASEGAVTTCPLPQYPNASCTGAPSGTSFTTHSGDFNTSSAGQVISGMRITGDVFIQHSGVIIRNSEVYGHIKNATSESFTIEDTTVGPTSGCFSDAAIGNNNYTATRVRLRGFAEGFRVEQGGNVTVKHSFIKFCNPGTDNHADALQGYLAGSDVTFEHNTVDMRDIPKELDYVTAAVFWSDDSGNNVTYKDNLISGGSFTIRIHVGSGHTVSGNKIINNSWLYGPVSSNCSAIAWSNNSIVEIDSSYNITQTVSSLACAE